MSSMAFHGGPMNFTPAAVQALAKPAFSLRKPKPGWMASQFSCCAIAMIRAPSR